MIPNGDYTCLMTKLINTNFLSPPSGIADCGATRHMCFDTSLLVKYSEVTGSDVEMGARANVKICGRGDVPLVLTVSWDVRKFLFQNIQDVLNFEYSLVPVSTMDLTGVFTGFRNGRCTISINGVHVTGFLERSLYEFKERSSLKTVGSVNIPSPWLWQERVSYLNEADLLKMSQSQIALGLLA